MELRYAGRRRMEDGTTSETTPKEDYATLAKFVEDHPPKDLEKANMELAKVKAELRESKGAFNALFGAVAVFALSAVIWSACEVDDVLIYSIASTVIPLWIYYYIKGLKDRRLQ